MARVPTVKVCNPSNPEEFIIINEADYDADSYELWEGETAPESSQEPVEGEGEGETPEETEEGQGQGESEASRDEEQAPEDEGGEDTESEAESEDEEGPDPLLAMPVDELRKAVREVEDAERLERVLEVENRATAQAAIQAQLSGLRGDDEE